MLAELARADALMTRYAEIGEAAAKETVEEMLNPGSGIKQVSIESGKHEALNQENLRLLEENKHQKSEINALVQRDKL